MALEDDTHEELAYGTVISIGEYGWTKGFGFIRPDDGGSEDVIFYFSKGRNQGQPLPDGTPTFSEKRIMRFPEENDRVAFREKTVRMGRRKAARWTYV